MRKRIWSSVVLIICFFGVVLVGFLGFVQPKNTQAACGASTSSCKTCHEVQGADPVSKKGDWHTQHAFGDFCQACHLGVATETDKTKAHAGLIINPLTQPDQSCVSCHPADSAARVAKYGGKAAGGSSSPSSSSGSGAAATGSSSSAGTVTPSAAATQIPPSANPNFDLIDFNGNSVPWLAWVIGIINAFVVLILIVLIWRWKKGVWPWYFLKGRKKNVHFNTLSPEAQEIFNYLLEGDMQTVLALQEILKRKEGSKILRAVAHLPENVLLQLQTLSEDEIKSLSSLSDLIKSKKEGKNREL